MPAVPIATRDDPLTVDDTAIVYDDRRVAFEDMVGMTLHFLDDGNALGLSRFRLAVEVEEGPDLVITKVAPGQKYPERLRAIADVMRFALQYVVPRVAERVSRRLRDDGDSLPLGLLRMTGAGITRRRILGLFGRPVLLPWSEVAGAAIKNGHLIIDDGKDRSFTGWSYARIPLMKPNAILVPDLVPIMRGA